MIIDSDFNADQSSEILKSFNWTIPSETFIEENTSSPNSWSVSIFDHQGSNLLGFNMTVVPACTLVPGLQGSDNELAWTSSVTESINPTMCESFSSSQASEVVILA